MIWLKVEIAPFDRDVEVAVVDGQKIYPVIFPCRRTLSGWTKADSGKPITIHPTHWREWEK
jgi:hypothetical protein